MDSAITVLLRAWTFDPWIIVPLEILALLYLRGWWQLHLQRPQRFSLYRLGSFQLGVLLLCFALISPLEALARVLLQAHMVQHLVLTMLAPSLLVYGAPVLPLLRGLPHGMSKRVLGPVLSWSLYRRLERCLAYPATAWLTFVITMITWHVPALYELALRAHFWHHVQHFCFLGAGILFWWPVLQPWPSRPGWAIILYLLLADIQNTVLSAALIFSERLLYPTYLTAPRLWNISALDDQATAGAIMWVAGSLIYLVPIAMLVIQLLDTQHGQYARRDRQTRIVQPSD